MLLLTSLLASLLLSVPALLLVSLPAGAATLSVQVVDRDGKPLSDAVVYSEQESGTPPSAKDKTAEVRQEGRRFIPLVSVVQAGTSITFPNNDSVRHHVYSFSPTKTFELKLYAGVPRGAVVFDKPGTVELGCNIHDQMIAYVQVVNTPYFGKTDATGGAKIELPAGRYRLKAWHLNMPPREAHAQQALVMKADDVTANFKLNLKPASVEQDKPYQPKNQKY